MTVSLRHSHEFKDYNLEKLYGVLKTYELEIQHNDEIKKVKGRTNQLPLLKRTRRKKPVKG